MMKSDNRFAEIDLLRFLAAMLVLLYHFIVNGPDTHISVEITSNTTIKHFAAFGKLGVQLFFILSGFCIMLSIKQDEKTYGFIIKRFIRLYPAYWLAILFACIVYSVFLVFSKIGLSGAEHKNHINCGLLSYLLPIKSILYNVSMLQYFFKIPDLVGTFWTLSFELRFYFLMAIIIFLRQRHQIPYIIFSWLIISYLCISIPDAYQNTYLNVIVMPLYSSFFISGVTLYLIQYHGFNLSNSVLFLLGQPINLYNLYVATGGKSRLIYSVNINYYELVIYYSITTLILIGIITRKLILPQKYHKLAFLVGGLSYPIYLCHGNCGFIIYNALSLLISNKWIGFIIVLSVIFGVSFGILKLEKSGQKLLKKFLLQSPSNDFKAEILTANVHDQAHG